MLVQGKGKKWRSSLSPVVKESNLQRNGVTDKILFLVIPFDNVLNVTHAEIATRED